MAPGAPQEDISEWIAMNHEKSVVLTGACDYGASFVPNLQCMEGSIFSLWLSPFPSSAAQMSAGSMERWRKKQIRGMKSDVQKHQRLPEDRGGLV